MKSTLAVQTPTGAETRVVRALQASRNILAITGAGISAESGLPTFRGEGCGGCGVSIVDATVTVDGKTVVQDGGLTP